MQQHPLPWSLGGRSALGEAYRQERPTGMRGLPAGQDGRHERPGGSRGLPSGQSRNGAVALSVLPPASPDP
jgi:hypothetical protein